MWIMLTTKLPTEVSPPKLSIHWSTAWSMPASEQLEAEEHVVPWTYGIFGRAPLRAGARRIHYAGKDIRVFPHEYSRVPSERLRQYMNESHELVAGDTAGEAVTGSIRSGARKEIYDAALVDGCDHAQAVMIALGENITMPDPEIPAIGWFRCRLEFARFFCSEAEMKEA